MNTRSARTFLLTLASASAAFALDIQVPGDQATIQGAINAASNGDKIIVAPGTYQESIDFGGKDVELLSSAGNLLTVLTMTDTNGISMGPAGSLVGFTIQGGKLPDGGAVTVEGVGSYISGNILEGNLQFSIGDASINVRPRSAPVIEGNVFRNNGSRSPGGTTSAVILMEPDAAPLIANNVFHDNASAAVADFFPRPGSDCVVVNNTMVRNNAGIRFRPSPAIFGADDRIIRNNIIVDSDSGVVFFGPPGETSTIENNLVFGNGANYAGLPDPTGSDGNISADPLFINSAANDFRPAPSSPAIDAGTNMSAPDFDFDDNPRPEDGDGDGTSIVDIGAFEAGSQVGVGLVITGGPEHECNTTGGALIAVGLATNPEDLALASVRFLVNGQQAADASPAEVFAPLGVSLIRVEATTDDGTVLEDEQFVSVVDTTPPSLRAWFEDRRTGQVIESISSRRMHHLVIRIEARDLCDPDPEVDSVLGTPVADGMFLSIQGNRGQTSLATEELTLKASATDAGGNTSSATASLKVGN